MVRRLLPEDKLSKTQKQRRKFLANNPEVHERQKKYMREWYRRNKIKFKIRKHQREKQQREDDIKLLGGKCVSCGELYNPHLRISNLQFDHTFYVKSKAISVDIHYQIKDLIDQGIDPNEQFLLFCVECHRIITA